MSLTATHLALYPVLSLRKALEAQCSPWTPRHSLEPRSQAAPQGKAPAGHLFCPQRHLPLTHGGTSLSSAAATSPPLKADEASARRPSPRLPPFLPGSAGAPLPPPAEAGAAGSGSSALSWPEPRRRAGGKSGAGACGPQRQPWAARADGGHRGAPLRLLGLC